MYFKMYTENTELTFTFGLGSKINPSYLTVDNMHITGQNNPVILFKTVCGVFFCCYIGYKLAISFLETEKC